jgi:5-hydroxyisourate hydrolase-like protein (transthyretin family)
MLGTGSVTIENSLKSPYANFPEGNGIITIITLQGTFQGLEEIRCDLELSDITLLNDQNEPIEYDPPINGAYTIVSVTYQITINVHSDYWVETDEGEYKLPVGANVTISGYITPNPGSGINVTIQVIKTNPPAEDLVTVKTDDNGYYFYVWTTNMTYVGPSLEFQAVWFKENREEVTTSTTWGTIEVVIKESSKITLKVDPETVLLGKTVMISGDIQPERPRVNVTIYYKASGETTWTLLKTVKTNNESRFSCTWSFEQLGTYEIKANWTGDSFTKSAESKVKTVRVVEKIEEGFLEIVMRHLPYILAGIAAVVVIVVIYFVKIRKS